MRRFFRMIDGIKCEFDEFGNRVFRCGFNLTHINCDNIVSDQGVYCHIHANPKCACCGKSATHMCGATSQGFVCNSLLCDDCKHELTVDGCNVHGYGHVPKEQLLRRSWIVLSVCKTIGCELHNLDSTCNFNIHPWCDPISDFLLRLESRKHGEYVMAPVCEVPIERYRRYYNSKFHQLKNKFKHHNLHIA